MAVGMTEGLRLLHRQVHPSWIQEGRITSQAFSPTPKDLGLLSVYLGSPGKIKARAQGSAEMARTRGWTYQP